MSMPEKGPRLPTSYCVIGTAWRPELKEESEQSEQAKE
jgi:hypothetical protein